MQIALIVGVTTMFPATISACFSYLAARDAAHALAVSRKTEENTNHMKDELVAEVRSASFAAGQKHESNERDARGN